MSRFDEALKANPAPRALGDVTLRYEPSMLIGETKKGRSGWRSLTAWAAGLLSIFGALAALVLKAELAFVVPLLVCGALGLAAATFLERHEKRQRRFVANFGTTSLRLDFQSPIAGQPRTLVVPFDSVKAVGLLEQADGDACLCVDFERGGALLREVLVAFIGASQHDDAQRLSRVLEGAFGLGEVPADSPLFGGPTNPSDEPPTTFEG
jgi:hypothetical protein